MLYAMPSHASVPFTIIFIITIITIIAAVTVNAIASHHDVYTASSWQKTTQHRRRELAALAAPEA